MKKQRQSNPQGNQEPHSRKQDWDGASSLSTKPGGRLQVKNFVEKEIAPGLTLKMYKPGVKCGVKDCIREQNHENETDAQECRTFNKTWQMKVRLDPKGQSQLYSINRGGRDTVSVKKITEEGKNVSGEVKRLLEQKEAALKAGNTDEARKIRRQLRRLGYKRYTEEAETNGHKPKKGSTEAKGAQVLDHMTNGNGSSKKKASKGCPPKKTSEKKKARK